MIKGLIRLLALAFGATLAAALAAKFLLESHGDPSTQEIDLVSIFDGRNLVSEADPFYGGKILTVFGGVLLDLRKATPAPTGMHVDIQVLMGGVSLVVPIGWRVVFEGNVFAGGFDDSTQPTEDPDAPVVRVTGRLAFGGFQVTTKSPVEAVV